MEKEKIKYLKVFITAVFLFLIIPLNVSLFGDTVSNVKTVSAVELVGPILSGGGIAEHTTGSVILVDEDGTGRVYKTDLVLNKWNYTDVTVASQPPMMPIWASISNINVPEDGTKATISYDTSTGIMYVLGIEDLKTNLDASDLEVVFSVKPQQGVSMNQYSIMVVPESEAASFDITKASVTTGQSCTVVSNSGASSYVQKLSNTSKDVNGNLIKPGVPYKIFIDAISSDNQHKLSPASSSITLHSNKLSGLAVSGGTGTLNPGFNEDTTIYTVNVDSTVMSINLTPTGVDNTATIKINGTLVQSGTTSSAINLASGNNQMVIQVSASGLSVKNYIINVFKSVSNNNLVYIKVYKGYNYSGNISWSDEQIELTPHFAPYIQNYTTSIADDVNIIRLDIQKEDANSTVKIKNESTNTNVNFENNEIGIPLGTNVICIVVTAENGDTKTYIFTIEKQHSGIATAIQTALSQGSSYVAVSTSSTGTAISATDFNAILNSGLGITADAGLVTFQLPPSVLQNIAAQASGCSIAISSRVTTDVQELQAMSSGKPKGVEPLEAIQVSLTGINVATGVKTDIHNLGDEATLMFTGVTQAGVLAKLRTGAIDGKALKVWYVSDDGKLWQQIGGKYNANIGKVEFKTTHFSTYVLAYSTVGDETEDKGSSKDDKDSSSSLGTPSQTGTAISSGTESNNSVKVTGITIDKSERTISEGNTVQLNINIAPSNATNKAVKWTSSDEKIATVDNSGKVTAIAQGKVVITATSADGNFSASCNLTITEKLIPEIKFVGLGHSPLVEGDKEDFIISSGYKENVQYRIYLNVDGTWQEVTKGYSEAASGKDTFTITPDYTFVKGQYQGRVYVKKAGTTGSKEENGIDFDSYYTYNINCVDRDDANRVYTAGNLNISKDQAASVSAASKTTGNDSFKAGEKVTITGIDGISGIPGPYYYRLSIYDVANNKWTNNVVPYSEKLEWTPSAAGTYVLDIHVITPNSVLWNKVQEDPTLIYGGYEGWKIKTVKVN